MSNTEGSNNRKTRDQLLKKIETLAEAVESLRDRIDHLKTERNQLQKENRGLRRQLTESRLVNQLERSVAETDEDVELERSVPSPSEQLYQLLPPSFSFPAYFRIADNEDLDTETARRCLQYFLSENQIAQTGSRLRKTNGSTAKRPSVGNGQASGAGSS